MLVSEYKNLSELARLCSISAPAMHKRAALGWEFATINGKVCMYNPKGSQELSGFELREVIITHPAHDFSKREMQLVKVEDNA
jgi:hypothetical protein